MMLDATVGKIPLSLGRNYGRLKENWVRYCRKTLVVTSTGVCNGSSKMQRTNQDTVRQAYLCWVQ